MKNKILAISIIFILISFTFINNYIFATDSIITTTLPSISNIVSDSDNWFIYFHEVRQLYILFYSNGSIIYYPDDGHYSLQTSELSYAYILNNGEWVYDRKNNSGFVTWSYDVISSICASNFDLYDTSNNVVFQKSPTLSTLKGMNFRQTVWETFQTMIRGIIPYLIALVVGLVAFWKAWQLLLKELRKA